MALVLSGDSPSISGTYQGGVITSGTAVASTSGTAIDFTSIPSWVKRITVMFSGVSTNGSSLVQLQVGSGSVTTTGYVSNGINVQNALSPIASSSTTGMLLLGVNASSVVFSGAAVLVNISGNTWCYQSSCGRSDASIQVLGAGQSPTLGGTLDRIRITTVNGTDTFDAGSINILYE